MQSERALVPGVRRASPGPSTLWPAREEFLPAAFPPVLLCLVEDAAPAGFQDTGLWSPHCGPWARIQDPGPAVGRVGSRRPCRSVPLAQAVSRCLSPRSLTKARTLLFFLQTPPASASSYLSRERASSPVHTGHAPGRAGLPQCPRPSRPLGWVCRGRGPGLTFRAWLWCLMKSGCSGSVWGAALPLPTPHLVLFSARLADSPTFSLHG